MDVLKALLARITTAALFQLGFAYAVASFVESVLDVDFGTGFPALAALVFAWHGFINPHLKEKRRQRQKEAERLQQEVEKLEKQRHDRRVAIEDAYESVNAAVEYCVSHAARGIDPAVMMGASFGLLKSVRDTTDDVALFIENPPPRVGATVSLEYLEAWLIMLREARRTR